MDMSVVKLSVSMRRILEALAKRDKRPMELKEELGLPDSTLHVSLRKLEEMGLVERKVSDKKYAVYGLTERGREVVKEFIEEKEEKVGVRSLVRGKEMLVEDLLLAGAPFRFLEEGKEEAKAEGGLERASLVGVPIEARVPVDIYSRFVVKVFEDLRGRIEEALKDAGVEGEKMEKVERILIEFALGVLIQFDQLYTISSIKAMHEMIHENLKELIVSYLLK